MRYPAFAGRTDLYPPTGAVRQPLLGALFSRAALFVIATAGTSRFVNEMTQKMAIDGIKLSPPLLAVRVRNDPALPDLTPRLCRLLTIARVNIAFMTASSTDAASCALCCIDPGQHGKVAHLIEQDDELKAAVRFQGQVGLLTLFPHRARLKILGLALQYLNHKNIGLLGMASSISALTFVIEYAHLEDAAAILRDRLDLPWNPAPFRAEFAVRQEKLTR
jgi:aspartokinase